MAHIPQRSSISIFSAHRCEYDVFLSFRGEDTRKTFTDHLFHELQRKQIKVFRDVEVKKGTDFTSMLPTAIEESRFVIIVLSPNYASSTWCLRELSKAFECKKDGKKIQRIIPIFYNVKPSDVREQRGTFDKAFKKHEKNLIENARLQEWRNSLREVSHLSGWNSQQYGYEGLLTKEIAASVSIELFCACCALRIDDEEQYFNCIHAVWHPKCFLCKACHLPFTDDKFWDCGNHPYHKECYMARFDVATALSQKISGIGIATGDSDANETMFGFTDSVPLPVPPPVSLVDSNASGRTSIFSSFKGKIFTATNNFINAMEVISDEQSYMQGGRFNHRI